MAYISIAEYTKKTGIKSKQLIYNRIANGKMIKDKDWTESKVEKIKKLVREDYKI